MTRSRIDEWLRQSVADAERRGLAELTPQLEAFSRLLYTLRTAEFNQRADGQEPRHADH